MDKDGEISWHWVRVYRDFDADLWLTNGDIAKLWGVPKRTKRDYTKVLTDRFPIGNYSVWEYDGVRDARSTD